MDSFLKKKKFGRGGLLIENKGGEGGTLYIFGVESCDTF